MIILLSDTHEQKEAVDAALRLIDEREPELVLHCGDFTSPEIFQRFVGLPFHSVFGNCDYDREAFLEKAQALGMHPPKDSLELEVSQKRIFMIHGDRQRTLNEVVAHQSHDYVFHGHTHFAENRLEGRTRVINPGAFTRVLTKTIAQIDLETGSWKLLPV